MTNAVQNSDVKSNDQFDAYIVGKKKNRVLAIDRDTCKGCKVCISVCPVQALFMSSIKSSRGYYYPMETGDCTACKKCVEKCPNFAISLHKLKDVMT